MPAKTDLPSRRRERSRGQSLAELALILPVILLIALIALDFGRIYLGFVNLQQMTRIAADFAATNATAWSTPGDAADQARYQEKIRNDARFINCTLPVDGGGATDVPDPMFPSGFDLGDPVTVSITCSFDVITPVISQVLGGQVLVGSSTTYPVKEGAVASVPGGGGGVVPAPSADFIATPTSGYGPLEVTFIDVSLGSPTSWIWNFGNGANAFTRGPHTQTYDCAGNPGDTCSYTAQVQVSNTCCSDSASTTITVTVPPAAGPIAEFSADPMVGEEPLAVDFTFDDVRGGTVTYSSFSWDFGDGSTSSAQDPSHTYASPGTYDVTLTVTDDVGAADTQLKQGFIHVLPEICTVPDFAGIRRNSAQGVWAAAGFSTTVSFMAGNGNYIIQAQSLLGGTIDPQPLGCDSQITVGP